MAVAVGPVLGGAITSGLSWRWIFFVNLPVGIVALLVTLRAVPETKDPHPRRLDWIGFVTFSAGLALLVFGLIRSNEAGWGSTQVLGSLAAAVILLLAFAIAESLQREPMFDLSLFRVPTFIGGLIAAFAISASLFSLLTYLVIYMQNLLGYSAIETGVRFLPLSLAIFFTAGIAGRLSAKVPTRLLIGPGFALIARRAAADARPGGRLVVDDAAGRADRWPGSAPGSSTCRSPRPRSPSWSRRGRAWRRGSTPPSARSGSPPASPRSARSSRTRRRRPAAGPRRPRASSTGSTRSCSSARSLAAAAAVASFALIRQRDFEHHTMAEPVPA